MPPPFVIAITGSVSAGKTTFARRLQSDLTDSRVEVVTTDGFLHPNRILEERGLMRRKGFPESYDMERLRRFASDLRAGISPLHVPLYSHLHYDVIGEKVIDAPDVVIIEGLMSFAIESDFSIYIDAREDDLRTWFMRRFTQLRETAFRDPESFFHRLATMPEAEAMAIARDAWEQINLVNLREHILPLREKATLVIAKDANHVMTAPNSLPIPNVIAAAMSPKST